jgi:hypothetical protein
MKSEIEEVIRLLEKAQDMMHKQKYDEANTLIYRAQAQSIFIKDKLS